MPLVEVEKKLGYSFKDRKLLEQALTHRSYSNEHGRKSERNRSSKNGHLQSNERLEFLGDSVLGLIIAEDLLKRFPEYDEGRLTLMKHRLVNTETLADIACELELGKMIRISRGEENTGGRKKVHLLADAVEAVIGAVFIEGGYIAARETVLRVFKQKLEQIDTLAAIDYKSRLQEILQSKELSAPSYELLRFEGAPHERTFYVVARWQGGSASGYGRSKKAAEMMAAAEAIAKLEHDKPG
ncbi:MAG TPA: ribonuclease III [Pyrinomonadaceae bacterium]|nr:ribonuclease III [Pyrinomonadaceae bacterium]